ncbi:MAG: peptidylprolyl isomerase [Desulfuromonadales bacterium]|nr:peptidylprolyl isomerase [Desulfuromonadales bacterium]NIR34106.1 peptidylprolyl isomerase [Desulfuromonadales bacterium]NIS41562.1 peptidylprolyl isomerase [Desulfuromonadales bacterium]
MITEAVAAKRGDKVSVHYIGTLDNGRIFDQADDDSPLVFTIGADEVFPALEQAVLGMRAGEVKNLTIVAEQAYGPRRDQNILTVARDYFPENRQIRVGEKLQVEFGSGRQIVMRVMRVNDETITLDGNHPLAGCDLTFALKLAAIG